jgi:hypothetical protein
MEQTLDLFTSDPSSKSEFLGAVRRLKPAGAKSVLFGDAVRALTADEIAVLERQGNRAEHWDLVRVATDFQPGPVRNCTFRGTCALGSFEGAIVELERGVRVPAGLAGVMIVDSEIGSGSLVADVGLVSRTVVCPNAVVFRTGAVTGSAECTFGNGRPLAIGIETGGREVRSYAEMTVPAAEAVARRRRDRTFMDEAEAYVAAYTRASALPFTVVETGAAVRNSGRIRDSYIGPCATVDGVLLVENSTVLSSAEEPTRLTDGAFVRNSCVQWGCEVASMAIVDDSVLTEHAHVERHGKVTASIIGPNTGVAEGEVTSCLLGPFVGFHHQALLIAAVWPEGKGNVGYGANVGSNHTSKAPDQEIWPGEGMFFGLGVNVKFPADFTESPYSILSTGVDTLPQKVDFPFSLINKPSQPFEGLSPAINEIFPGWVLSDNIYMVKRNEGKYRKRNKARRSEFDFEVFRPEIVDRMINARERLRHPHTAQTLYSEKEIPGLGKNVMTESSRMKGIEAYDFHIRHYALCGLKRRIEELRRAGEKPKLSALTGKVTADPRWEHERNLLNREGLSQIPLVETLETLSGQQMHIARQVRISKEKDDARGAYIHRDYRDTHTPAEKDDFVVATQDEAERFSAEVADLIRYVNGL